MLDKFFLKYQGHPPPSPETLPSKSPAFLGLKIVVLKLVRWNFQLLNWQVKLPVSCETGVIKVLKNSER